MNLDKCVQPTEYCFQLYFYWFYKNKKHIMKQNIYPQDGNSTYITKFHVHYLQNLEKTNRPLNPQKTFRAPIIKETK